MFLVIFLSCGLAHGKSALKADWPYVAKKLSAAGLHKTFIKKLHAHYETKEFLQVLELNTLLFLRKSDYHGPQINDDAAKSVRGFMTANQNAIEHAEDRYSVPGEVIASLLWLESRFGDNEGAFHVPSVFLDMVQAERPAVTQHLFKAAHKFTDTLKALDRQEIRTRAHKRVAWAIGELKAIQKMHDSNPKVLDGFAGSFAGAFGMSQFLPSSYNRYARARHSDEIADLEKPEDAIASVANYLHVSGWRAAKKSHVKALMKYNNSHDYANAILKLSRQAVASTKDSPARTLASPETE